MKTGILFSKHYLAWRAGANPWWAGSGGLETPDLSYLKILLLLTRY